VAGLGSVEIPAMEKQGYDTPFSAAVTAASLEEIYKEIIPFLLHYITILCILTYFPGLTLWFPRILEL
jgi:TRAP-type C4-dicarboxylate transport system permease large subunit